MYKVLIVDDEISICNGLHRIIPWQEYGYEICGQAYSGREGIELAEALIPDLIIADIRMPGLNGLEMIQRLRCRGFASRVIMLTGYSEFQYAQEAVSLDVDAYMLKPIDEDELKEKVISIACKIEEHKQHTALRQTVCHASDRFLEAVVCGSLKQDLLIQYNQLYSFDLPWYSYQVAVLDTGSRMHLVSAGMNTILNFAVSFLKEHRLGYLFDTKDGLCILFKDYEVKGHNLSVLKTLVKRLQSGFDIHAVIAVGPIVYTLDEVPISYQNAVSLLENKFFRDDCCILSYDLQRRTSSHNTPSQSSLDDFVRRISMAMEMASRTQLDKVIDSMMDYMLAPGLTEHDIRSAYTHVYNSIVTGMVRNYPEISDEVASECKLILDIYHKQTLKMLHEHFKYLIRRTCDILDQCCPVMGMKRIISYIENNYGRNIKLSDIASAYGYNTSYLGRKFKEYTGIQFHAYLDDIRIKKAKEMLTQGYRVYEIARMVGYNDKDYFFIKFKKNTGISPREYRNNIRIDQM